MSSLQGQIVESMTMTKTNLGSKAAGNTRALTAKIVAAFLRGNEVAIHDLPGLIQATHAALVGVSLPPPEPMEQQQPAVSVKKSVTPGAVLCLECGKGQKMLKRHLQTAHGLSVEEYKSKWSLPPQLPHGGARLCRAPVGTGQSQRPRPLPEEAAAGGIAPRGRRIGGCNAPAQISRFTMVQADRMMGGN